MQEIDKRLRKVVGSSCTFAADVRGDAVARSFKCLSFEACICSVGTKTINFAGLVSPPSLKSPRVPDHSTQRPCHGLAVPYLGRESTPSSTCSSQPSLLLLFEACSHLTSA